MNKVGPNPYFQITKTVNKNKPLNSKVNSQPNGSSKDHDKKDSRGARVKQTIDVLAWI